MSSPSSTQDPDEKILAEFIAELERRGSAALGEYALRHPHLAERMRGLVGMQDVIEDARQDLDESVPERLGDFRIVRQIARGGMGEIYEAVQEHLGRRVAVKVIRRGRASEQARERFEREQKVLARLHQTHIIPIHMAGEEGRLQYFVMPYVEGAALHHVVQAARQFEPTRAGGSTPTLAEIAGQLAGQRKDTAQGAQASTGSFQVEPPAGTQEAVVPPAAARPLRLTRAYFRSVAEVMADAAEAVAHVHGVGILHRDLKPSNIMVTAEGKCWIVDFGLAIDQKDTDQPGTTAELPGPGLLTAPGAVPGTPEYLAPERLEGKADVRSDVWGLGATLYELLTLRHAFRAPGVEELCAKIRDQEPTRPKELIPDVPRDLEAICRKALRKEPAQRYPTAAAFAEDLRRWLRYEPTTARPARTPRRVWLWARRNPGWAAATALTVVLLLTVVGLILGLETSRRTAAEERLRESRRQTMLKDLYQGRTGPHTLGWRDRACKLVGEIAEVRKDGVVQGEAAALLAGLDAELEKEFRSDASSVVFDQKGKRLLIGGFTDFKGKAVEPARVWAGGIAAPRQSTRLGSGPVAFRAADGAPIQLVPEPDNWSALTLWDVDRQQALGTFKLGEKPLVPEGDLRDRLALALSADGSLVAASTTLADGTVTLRVWEVRSGKTVRTIEKVCTAVAFSPDNALLAGGDEGGTVTVWSLVKPDAEPVTLAVGRTAIRCLAFTEDRLRTTAPGPRARSWLLAAGEVGGNVTIWELPSRRLKARCRGSKVTVHALAFSPDGTLLASAGRYHPRLWDVATGQLLLDLDRRNWMTGVAFSPDGERLAVSYASVFDEPGGVDVWRLQNGRGVRTFRGLDNPIATFTVSRDERFLAAMTHTWQVGIWGLDDGQLLHVLNVPPGMYPDHAGMAFSPDGNRFAFSTHTRATLWDVEAGSVIDSWALPPAFNDRMAFDRTGRRLLLVRLETEGGAPPAGNVPFDKFPRVVRAYDLLNGKRTKSPVAEIKDFKVHAYVRMVAPDASLFVVDGLTDAADRRKRNIGIYDGQTGNKLYSQEVRVARTQDEVGGGMDPTGQYVSLGLPGTSLLWYVEARKVVRTHTMSNTLSAHAKFWTSYPNVSIYDEEHKPPLVTLDIDDVVSGGVIFTPRTDRLVLGNRDGTITVHDLEEIQRRLAAVGLGW